jgi:hypothetical protein
MSEVRPLDRPAPAPSSRSTRESRVGIVALGAALACWLLLVPARVVGALAGGHDPSATPPAPLLVVGALAVLAVAAGAWSLASSDRTEQPAVCGVAGTFLAALWPCGYALAVATMEGLGAS